MLRGDEILSTPRAIATPGESKLSSGLSEENETEDEEHGLTTQGPVSVGQGNLGSDRTRGMPLDLLNIYMPQP